MPEPIRDYEMVAQVVHLIHDEGKSFRQTAKILNRHVKTIWRWWQYAKEAKLVDVGKKSTKKRRGSV